MNMDNRRPNSNRTLDALIVQSPAMRAAVQTAQRLARSEEPVFVDGSAGTGRKLVARLIHEESPRGHQPLATIHCAKLTVDVLDRVLFGDRVSGVPGKFEEAAGGSLLLIDLEDLSPVAQERLLGVLDQSRYITSSGGSNTLNCRMLTTGNRDEIQRRVRLGHFSEALFSKLGVAQMRMPTLAERREDIPDLVGEVLHELAARSRIEVPMVPYHYMELLTQVAWPENVRQLRNHIESVMVLSGGEFDPQIIREHFMPEGSPATIKGAVQTLWNKLRGTSTQAALSGSRAG
jgi:DNA-binding NtrC family response regulator